MIRKMSFVALLVAIPMAASAQFFSTSFEASEGYTGGASGTNLAGQQSWAAGTGTGAVSHFRVFTAAPVAFTGSNGVLAQYNGSQTNTFASVGRNIGTMANGFTLQSRMWIDPGFFQSSKIFGIYMNNGLGLDGTSFHGLAIDGAGGIRATNNYTDFWGAGGVRQTRALSEVTGRWLNLRIDFNPLLTTNQVTYTITGLGGSNSTFVHGMNRGGTAAINGVGIASDWISSTNNHGQAAFDDFSVQAVPEPATMAALALGFGAIAARRRRSKK